jgi:hypothetical protein
MSESFWPCFLQAAQVNMMNGALLDGDCFFRPRRDCNRRIEGGIRRLTDDDGINLLTESQQYLVFGCPIFFTIRFFQFIIFDKKWNL